MYTGRKYKMSLQKQQGQNYNGGKDRDYVNC